MLDIKHWSQSSFVSHWVSGMPSFMPEVGHWFLEHPKGSAVLGAKILLCLNLSLKAAFTCAEVQSWGAQNDVFAGRQRLFAP